MKKQMMVAATVLLAGATLAACGSSSQSSKSSASQSKVSTSSSVTSNHSASDSATSASSHLTSSAANESTSASQSGTKSLTKDTVVATEGGIKLTNGALGILVYTKYYPDSVDMIGKAPMYLSTDSQGRQEIGFGTGDSDLFYRLDGNQVTVWKIQQEPGKTTSEQGYDQSTVSIHDLIEDGFITDAQEHTVMDYARQLKTN